jgi:hypothetical protein
MKEEMKILLGRALSFFDGLLLHETKKIAKRERAKA